MTRLDRGQIAKLIPHAGAMCLLDSVESWDSASIRCLSWRHLAKDNPLRGPKGLGILSSVEFAAQAMAVHSRLSAGSDRRPAAGYLVSLRDVKCRNLRLDNLGRELLIDANLLMGDEKQAVYTFAVGCAGAELISGRAAVILEAI